MSSDAALCEIQRAKDVEQRFLKYLQKKKHSQAVEQIVQGKYYMEDSEAPMFCKCFSVCIRITIAEPIRHHFPFDKWDRVFGNRGASLMHMRLEVTSQGHSHYTLLLPEGSPENGGGYVLPVPQLSNHPSAVLDLTSQRCEVSCGAYPFGDPHGWPLPIPFVTSRCPISIPYLNYLMIKSPDIPIRFSSSAVLRAYSKVQS